MPYIKETITTKKIIEVSKTYSGRYGAKGIPRSSNRKKTPEQMQKANERQSEKKLRGELEENFEGGDLHNVLTYAINPPDPVQAKKYLDKFLRGVRREMRKIGKELKYIIVTEYKNTRIHHHVIMNYFDLAALQKLWPYGKIRPTLLDDSGDYHRLAAYLIKETSKTFRDPDATQRQRWTPSRNLKKPNIKKEVVRSIQYAEEPRPVKGYYIIPGSLINGINPITGYPYQIYRMARLDKKEKRKPYDQYWSDDQIKYWEEIMVSEESECEPCDETRTNRAIHSRPIPGC